MPNRTAESSAPDCRYFSEHPQGLHNIHIGTIIDSGSTERGFPAVYLFDFKLLLTLVSFYVLGK